MIGEAFISHCGQYRYVLRRSWDVGLPALGFIMLNPSTADASEDDPTIRKCIGFAQRLGFGAIAVTNLYAYRATKPVALKAGGYPRGPENDAWIERVARETSATVCAWGVNARNLSRPREVLGLLREAGVQPKALRLTDDGIPWHPLMLPYTCTLLEMPT